MIIVLALSGLALVLTAIYIFLPADGKCTPEAVDSVLMERHMTRLDWADSEGCYSMDYELPYAQTVEDAMNLDGWTRTYFRPAGKPVLAVKLGMDENHYLYFLDSGCAVISHDYALLRPMGYYRTNGAELAELREALLTCSSETDGLDMRELRSVEWSALE